MIGVALLDQADVARMRFGLRGGLPDRRMTAGEYTQIEAVH